MKPFLVVSILLFAFGAGSTQPRHLTALERQRLVAHLEMTGAWLVDEVSRLSAAQLEFRPAPEAWSIMQVVEHLTIAEPIYWRQFKEAMKMPPHDEKQAARDADVLWYGIDRTQRQKAVPSEEPRGQLHDLWEVGPGCAPQTARRNGPVRPGHR